MRCIQDEEWIARAESAYLEQVGSSEFCRLQAELFNSLYARSLASRGSQGMGKLEGCSRREAVWRLGKTVLYRYCPLPFVRRSRAHPVLICYAQVNRPYVLDLEPECSLVRRLVACGLTVYLIDWGYPDATDKRTTLEMYLQRYLGGCVTHILRTERVERLNLIGVCQGGTFSLCHAALRPAGIANLVLMVTPVDFRTPEDLLSRWARDLDPELLRRGENFPGAALNAAFLALAPFRLLFQKYARLLASPPTAADLERFVRLERWIYDSPDQPATAFAQFLQWFYQENRLACGNLSFAAGDVRLERVRQPVLNIYATQDRIVPPASSLALRGRLGSRDYTELPVDAGHIGVFVSRRSRVDVPGEIGDWLTRRA